MHEALVVEAGHDEHRVGLVLAELHHGVVRGLRQLAPRRARHVPLEVLPQPLQQKTTTRRRNAKAHRKREQNERQEEGELTVRGV